MLATSIYKSVKGAGTNEQLLIQAVIPYPNSVIRGIAPAYQKRKQLSIASDWSIIIELSVNKCLIQFGFFFPVVFGRDVIQDVKGDTSRDFEKILVAMLQGQREENTNVDMGQASADAEQLYNAGEKYVILLFACYIFFRDGRGACKWY